MDAQEEIPTQAEIDRRQWRAIELTQIVGWVNAALTLIGLVSVADDLRFWHDHLLVPAGVWLKETLPFALVPFRVIYYFVEWWRWGVHGVFDLVSLHLPRTLQSVIGVYVFLGNTTLIFLRRNVNARGRVPYERLEFLKGVVIQLVYVRTILRWLFARPHWNEQYLKYFIDAVLFAGIWIGLVVAVSAPLVREFQLAKGAVLAMVIALYGIIISDGLYIGSTRWYTVIFFVAVAFLYTVDSVYHACCLT
jgi:hypothetical protein